MENATPPGLLTKLRRLIMDRVVRPLVIPPLARRGWRPAREIPPFPAYLGTEFGYDDERRIKNATALLSGRTLVSFERLVSLWQQVSYLDRYQIPGVLVECGVWRGGCAALMALAHMAAAGTPVRHLHLFDSFQGDPEPRAEVDGASAVEWAGASATGALRPIGRNVGSLQENRHLLEEVIAYPAHLIHYHVGWFQETLPRYVSRPRRSRSCG